MVKKSLMLLSILAAGCVSEEPEVVDFTGLQNVQQTQAIKGGVAAPDDTATVGMYSFGGICSGTLIAPNLVLTAQHCVARTATEYVICGQTTFGNATPAGQIFITTRPRLTNQQSAYHNVSQVLLPPGSRQMCGYDIALLVLADNVPETEAVPLPPRIDEPLRNGERYVALGFGHVGDGSGTGLRRKIENRVVQCAGTGCPNYTSVSGSEFLGTEGTCQGDSGGTARDEKGRVMGALSRGPNGCAASIYSDVFGWSEWLREVGADAAERGGYEPHIWVTHGVTEIPEDDLDLDGVLAGTDNCPDLANPDQSDEDGDGKGDMCDFNQDGDSIDDEDDNCPMVDNEDQSDADDDGLGDACDDDADEDGVDDEEDDCIGDATECAPPLVIVQLNEEPNSGCATSDGSSGISWILILAVMVAFRRRRFAQ